MYKIISMPVYARNEHFSCILGWKEAFPIKRRVILVPGVGVYIYTHTHTY